MIFMINCARKPTHFSRGRNCADSLFFIKFTNLMRKGLPFSQPLLYLYIHEVYSTHYGTDLQHTT